MPKPASTETASRRSLRDRRQSLLDQRRLRGEAFCRAYAREADAWLAEIAAQATNGHERSVALVAVGGYGRGSLCPYSDLDVVLVYSGRSDIDQVADAIWYPIWDEGVQLDHSVRRPQEVLAMANDDLRVALGLLDGRLIWGDPRVAEPLLEDAVVRWRVRLGKRWLDSLKVQMAARHAAKGDVAYLLEPDLKDGYGGLRDLNIWHAIASYAPKLKTCIDFGALQASASLLVSIRVELHRLAGRALDRLLLQEQDQVAGELSFSDADALMAAVAEAGRTIAWTNEQAWRQREVWEPHQSPKKGRPRFGLLRRGDSRSAEDGASIATARPGPAPSGTASEGGEPSQPGLRNGVVIVDGEVTVLGADDLPTPDPFLILRLAATAAEMHAPLSLGALQYLSEAATPVPETWPPDALADFVALLLTGRAAITSVEGLDQYGLLTRLLPEWHAVRNRPQRNAYHRFTVDRHLLETAANAAGLVDGIDRPDLLVLAALFHDIGKGSPGDHTDAGIALIPAIGRRLGLRPADVGILQTLVRYHLLLPDTATRRDLDDPATIASVAHAVGDRATLQLLAALTEADGKATGPSAWGTWKAGLVADLVRRTARYLAGEQPTEGDSRSWPPWLTPEHRALMDEARQHHDVRLVVEPPRVMLAAPDRPGLMASVAGVLALYGLDVRSADVAGEHEIALEVFDVDAPRGEWPESATLTRELEAVLDQEATLTQRLEARAHAYAPTRRPSSAHPLEPQVIVDNTASDLSTVVEVRGPDEVGLLHRLTTALFSCQLDVISARVVTLGGDVVDSFYVRDTTDQKIDDPDTLAAIEDALRRAAGPALQPGDEAAETKAIESPST